MNKSRKRIGKMAKAGPSFASAMAEYLFGELLSIADRAGTIAAAKGEPGMYMDKNRTASICGHALAYNISIFLHGLQWRNSNGTHNMASATRLIPLQSVKYNVAITDVRLEVATGGKRLSVPAGLKAHLREGISGTWTSDRD